MIKRKIWELCSILAVMSFLFVIGCGADNRSSVGSEPTTNEATGTLVNSTSCKLNVESLRDNTPLDKSCIEYQYSDTNVLLLSHINAGFNCCPGELSADITVEGNLITIEESESEAGCRCLCIYDLDYEIRYLESGVYQIRIVELYLNEEDEPLNFTIDLSSSPSGSYCVDRTHYPWGY